MTGTTSGWPSMPRPATDRTPTPRRATAPAALMAFLLCIAPGARAQTPAPAAATPPNVVVLLVDDAAFMDFGAFGGEARTPHIDTLAARGMMFTRYHTSPLCSPSRAMLLTGVDNHRNGVATIPEVLPPEQRGKPGYGLHLEPGVVTVAARLRASGYRTFMTGKWHLGDGKGQLPDSHGFDRSFALEASGADNWQHKSYMPYYASAPWFEDGKPARFPEGGYSSQVIVDRMIDYIGADTQSAQPFFAYLAFQAVHIPVQAPRAFTDRYRGAFDGGWDVLRAERWKRAQAMGLAPTDAAPPAMHETMRAWSALSPEEQRLQAASMEVYAGMLEAMDHHIGRLVAFLESKGALANTVFFVTSDNGPEPSDPLSQRGFREWMALNGYTRDIANLGERGSTTWIGPEWASAVATPGRLFKFYASEGGIRVPLIVAGPGVASGARADANAFVTDITPTILDMTAAAPPPAGAVSMDGRSLRPVLADATQAVYGPQDAVGVEVSGNAALFRGDYKLVRVDPPYGDSAWRLYDIARDPGETRDLSATLPDVFAEMKADYDAYAQRTGVLEMPPGYKVQQQVAANTLARQAQLHGGKLVAAGLVLLAGVALGVWALLRGRRRTAA